MFCTFLCCRHMVCWRQKAIVGENVDSTCKTWLVISCDVIAKGAKRKNVAVINTLQPNCRFPGITTLWLTVARRIHTWFCCGVEMTCKRVWSQLRQSSLRMLRLWASQRSCTEVVVDWGWLTLHASSWQCFGVAAMNNTCQLQVSKSSSTVVHSTA